MSDRSADGHRSIQDNSSDEEPPRATSATSSVKSGKSGKITHRPDFVSKGDMKKELTRAQTAEADLQRQLDETSAESAKARQMVTQLTEENEQMKLQYFSTRQHMQEQEEKNEARLKETQKMIESQAAQIAMLMQKVEAATTAPKQPAGSSFENLSSRDGMSLPASSPDNSPAKKVPEVTDAPPSVGPVKDIFAPPAVVSAPGDRKHNPYMPSPDKPPLLNPPGTQAPQDASGTTPVEPQRMPLREPLSSLGPQPAEQPKINPRDLSPDGFGGWKDTKREVAAKPAAPQDNSGGPVDPRAYAEGKAQHAQTPAAGGVSGRAYAEGKAQHAQTVSAEVVSPLGSDSVLGHVSPNSFDLLPPASDPASDTAKAKAPPPPPGPATPQTAVVPPEILLILNTQTQLLASMQQQQQLRNQENLEREERLQRESLEREEQMKRLVEDQMALKQRELKYLEEKDGKRRQVSQNQDLSIPEFQQQKMSSSPKAMIFYLSEYFLEVQLTLSARVPDEIATNKYTLDGKMIRKSAGQTFWEVIHSIVIEEFEELVKDNNHVFDSDKERKELVKIEKSAMSDIAQWTLGELREVLPTSLTGNAGMGSILSGSLLQAAQDRSGEMNTSYLIWKLYKFVFLQERNTSKWSNFVSTHQFKVATSLEGLSFEILKYQSLISFAVLTGAQLDANAIVQCVRQNLKESEALCEYPTAWRDQRDNLERQLSRSQVKPNELDRALTILSETLAWTKEATPKISKVVLPTKEKEEKGGTPHKKTRSVVDSKEDKPDNSSALSVRPAKDKGGKKGKDSNDDGGKSTGGKGDSSANVSPKPDGGTRDCWFYLHGGCTKGKDCLFKHDDSKVNAKDTCKKCGFMIMFHTGQGKDRVCPVSRECLKKKKDDEATSDAGSAATDKSGKPGRKGKGKGKGGKKGKDDASEVSPDDSASQVKPGRRNFQWQTDKDIDPAIFKPMSYADAVVIGTPAEKALEQSTPLVSSKEDDASNRTTPLESAEKNMKFTEVSKHRVNFNGDSPHVAKHRNDLTLLIASKNAEKAAKRISNDSSEVSQTAKTEGCSPDAKTEGCTPDKVNLGGSSASEMFLAIEPGYTRRTERAENPVPVPEKLSEIDAMIAEHIDGGFDSLFEEFTTCKAIFGSEEITENTSESEKETPASESGSSSVSFSCDPSAREAEGINVLGQERFSLFERLVTAGARQHIIAAALDVDPTAIPQLMLHLKKAQKPKSKKKMRVVHDYAGAFLNAPMTSQQTSFESRVGGADSTSPTDLSEEEDIFGEIAPVFFEAHEDLQWEDCLEEADESYQSALSHVSEDVVVDDQSDEFRVDSEGHLVTDSEYSSSSESSFRGGNFSEAGVVNDFLDQHLFTHNQNPFHTCFHCDREWFSQMPSQYPVLCETCGRTKCPELNESNFGYVFMRNWRQECQPCPNLGDPDHLRESERLKDNFDKAKDLFERSDDKRQRSFGLLFSYFCFFIGLIADLVGTCTQLTSAKRIPRQMFTGYYQVKRSLSWLIISVFLFGNPAHVDYQNAATRNDLLPEKDDIRISAKARPAARPTRKASDEYFGFIDDGSEYLVRPPEEGDKVIGEIVLEGLDCNPVVCFRTEEEEITSPNETLIMVPEGTMQVALGFKVEGQGTERHLVKDDIRLTAKWKEGHFWLNRDDTEIARDLLTRYWRSRRNREMPPPRDLRPSVLRFGRIRQDFDKSPTWVHNFTTKMLATGLKQEDLVKFWDKSTSLRYYLYLCRNKAGEIVRQNQSRVEVEEHLDAGAPKRVSFSVRPARHQNLEIPLSHYFTHRPKLAGCIGCEQGKMELTPIVRTKVDPAEKGIEGSNVRVDADYVGRTFPKGSEGSLYGNVMISDVGHFVIFPQKSKTEQELQAQGERFLSITGLEPKRVDFHGDQEFSTFGSYIERQGGTYNSGIANRSNTHARAEDAVKNALGAMKASALTSAAPAKDWPSLAKTLSVNISRESGGKYLGLYRGPLFVHGEISFLKLEPDVYTPPPTRPNAVKVQFMHYNLNSSHGIVIEFYDEHKKARRRTEVTSTAFEAGLPDIRPQFGYARQTDEKEPLSTYIQGLLAPEGEKEEPIEVPPERKLKKYEKAPKKKAKQKARGVTNQTFTYEDDPESEWCDGWNYATVEEKWFSEYDFSQHETCIDLGQTDAQDFDDDRTPIEVGIPENAQFCRRARPGRDFVRLVKVLKPKEISQHPYNRLDWEKAYKKEQTKMFETFKCFDKMKVIEMRDVPVGSHLIRNFGVHTVKDFDVEEDWSAGYRLVGGGNNVLKKEENQTWTKVGTVLDKTRDAIESATMESTRLFIHCNKIRGRKIRKKDADGAYLQAPTDSTRRPHGIYAELPACMIPPDSPALQMRRPVFEVLTSLYGLDDAGFSWDEFSHQKLEESNFHVYTDMSQSLYDHFPEGTDKRVLATERELDPFEYPMDDGQLSQYVDDFLCSEDADCGVFKELLEALRFKPSPDDDKDPGDIGRFVGSVWEDVNAEPDENGTYHYSVNQISYIKTFLKAAEAKIIELGGKPLRHADTPALAHDYKKGDPLLDDTPGRYKDICANIVCALLYVVRSTRVECLFSVCRMTRYLTRWHARQDLWLIRCLEYLNKTSEMKLHFSINPNDFYQNSSGKVKTYSDADLGADETKRSTSGGLGMIEGNRTKAMFLAYSKRQGSVGLSTPESEIVAATVLSKKVLTLHMIILRMLKLVVPLEILEDNEACQRIVGTGVSSQMSYLKRTVGLSFRWLQENIKRYINRVESDSNPSDLFTKPLERDKFERFREFIGIW